ncbi:uncharacterized protein LOC142349506 [Convolutriloba macropyga]|uniref:uncharacterized protein LOC142349506 n=1 Tax=Convolutriloba macropyga TaxID=536237 RepID=UPI003F527615
MAFSFGKIALSSFLTHLYLFITEVIAITNAGVSFGKCPELKGAPLDGEDYGGTWYEIKRADSFMEPGNSCNFIQNKFYTDYRGVRRIHVNNTGFDGRRYLSTVAIGTQTDLFRHSFNFDPSVWNRHVHNTQANFFNLYADKDFVLSYTCQGVANLMKVEVAILLARERFPQNAEKQAEVEKVLARHGIDKKLRKVSQEGCPPTQEEKQKLLSAYMDFIQN